MLYTHHQHHVVPVILQEPDHQGTLAVGLQARYGLLKIKRSTDPANANSAGKPHGQRINLGDLL
jgi:hypothetical protein